MKLPHSFPWSKLKRAWVFSYLLIYLPWFFYLEAHVTQYHIMQTPLDGLIPFCPYFIIPYLLWFFYVAAVFLFFLFRCPKHEFYRMAGYLFLGMSVSLLICTVYPNGIDLRPTFDPNQNIFTQVTAMLYQADTSTNVFPSIHVFVSAGVYLAIAESAVCSRYRWMRPLSFVLTFSIILSTMFLKQHSVIDVIGGLVLAEALHLLFYHRLRRPALSLSRASSSRRRRIYRT